MNEDRLKTAIDNLLKAYFPEELYNSKEWPRWDIVHNDIGLPPVYGTPRKQREEVKIFRQFPGSDNAFGLPTTFPFPKPNRWFFKHKNGKIYTYNYYILIMILEIFEQKEYEDTFTDGGDSSDLFCRTITCFLKLKEKGMMLEKKKLENKKLKLKSPFDYQKQWKKLMPPSLMDPKYKDIDRMLADLIPPSRNRLNENQIDPNKVFNQCKMTTEAINRFMDKKNKWFRPALEFTREVILRVFHDKEGNFKFVFAREFLDAMRRGNMDVSGFEGVFNQMSELNIITWKRAQELIGEDENGKIVIIEFDIKRVGHRAVFIPMANGRQCISVADVIEELLKDAIQGKDIFQHINDEDFHTVFECYKNLPSVLGKFNSELQFIELDVNRHTFIYVEKAASIKKRCNLIMNFCLVWLWALKKLDLEKLRIKKQLPFQNAFTKSDLKAELQRLGIGTRFPKILESSDEVYDVWTSRFRRTPRNSKDIAVILQYCQLNYIYEQCPNIARFYNLQNAARKNIFEYVEPEILEFLDAFYEYYEEIIEPYILKFHQTFGDYYEEIVEPIIEPYIIEFHQTLGEHYESIIEPIIEPYNEPYIVEFHRRINYILGPLSRNFSANFLDILIKFL